MTPLATIRQLTTGTVYEVTAKRAIQDCLDDGYPPHVGVISAIDHVRRRIEENQVFIMTKQTRDPESDQYADDTVKLALNNRISQHLAALRDRIRDASAATVEQWDAEDAK